MNITDPFFERILQQTREMLTTGTEEEHAYPVGTRVGAFRSKNPHKIELFGYGIYAGKVDHPTLRVRTPLIKLDDGRDVYGCECWWDTEDAIKAAETGRVVVKI